MVRNVEDSREVAQVPITGFTADCSSHIRAGSRTYCHQAMLQGGKDHAQIHMHTQYLQSQDMV